MSVGLVGLDQKRNYHRGVNVSCALHGQNISVIHTLKLLGIKARCEAVVLQLFEPQFCPPVLPDSPSSRETIQWLHFN